MTSAPETLRSAGIAPKRATVRKLAWATYEPIRPGVAIIDVTYLDNPEAVSVSKVEIRNPRITVNGVDPLYEAAYLHASATAAAHGYELERFSRA